MMHRIFLALLLLRLIAAAPPFVPGSLTLESTGRGWAGDDEIDYAEKFFISLDQVDGTHDTLVDCLTDRDLDGRNRTTHHCRSVQINRNDILAGECNQFVFLYAKGTFGK